MQINRLLIQIGWQIVSKSIRFWKKKVIGKLLQTIFICFFHKEKNNQRKGIWIFFGRSQSPSCATSYQQKKKIEIPFRKRWSSDHRSSSISLASFSHYTQNDHSKANSRRERVNNFLFEFFSDPFFFLP